MLRLALLLLLATTPALSHAQGVPVPLTGYAVLQPLGSSGKWSASVADAGKGETCLIARESGRVWAIRDKFVWQLSAPPRRMTRVEVYGDSVLIEDRDPERREEQWGAVILSDSVYKSLGKYNYLEIKLRTPRGTLTSREIPLFGFNKLNPVFDSPLCSGK
jgi:hypothetical protein